MTSTAPAHPDRAAVPCDAAQRWNPMSPISWLGTAVIATALGMTAAALRGEGTAINAYLFMNAGLSHNAAALVERTAVLVVLASAVAAFVVRWWYLLLPLSAYAFTEALARSHVGGHSFVELALITNAPRYAAPLALLVLLAGTVRRPWRSEAGGWMLRLALAAVFGAHGIQALSADPTFIDLVISSAENLAGIRVNESSSRAILYGIGWLDMLTAALFIVRPHPVVLGWAAFWGIVTASSRIAAIGWGAYTDVLVRATYFLSPIAVWCLVREAQDQGARRACVGSRDVGRSADETSRTSHS